MAMRNPATPSAALPTLIDALQRGQCDAATARKLYQLGPHAVTLALLAAADMNCDGLVNSFDISAFNLAVNDPETYAQTYPGCDILNGDANGDGYVDGKDVAAFSAFLTGGNAAVYRQYTWDAENRLIRVEPGGTPQTNNLKVEFQYDYRGRRIEKKVWTYNAGWSLTEHLKFIWGGAGDGPDDGWLLLLELDGASADAVLRRYTWGLDVAGLAGRMNSLAAAGGIGGLLAVQDAGASQDYVYFHDALGSVGQVLDLAAPTAGAAMVAKYEYDPYGHQTGVAGTYDQPFRFSGKYHDAETGLGYWGYRYYNPVLGRWINRDPLGELGGLNLYTYCGNEPAGRFDALGLSGDETPECGGSAEPEVVGQCAGQACTETVRWIFIIEVVEIKRTGGVGCYFISYDRIRDSIKKEEGIQKRDSCCVGCRCEGSRVMTIPIDDVPVLVEDVQLGCRITIRVRVTGMQRETTGECKCPDPGETATR